MEMFRWNILSPQSVLNFITYLLVFTAKQQQQETDIAKSELSHKPRKRFGSYVRRVHAENSRYEILQIRVKAGDLALDLRNVKYKCVEE